jgi:transcriptional regulator with XRE-family HTH domain
MSHHLATNPRALARVLIRLRERRKLSQAQLAARARMPLAVLRDLECEGDRAPNRLLFPALWRVLRVLRVPWATFGAALDRVARQGRRPGRRARSAPRRTMAAPPVAPVARSAGAGSGLTRAR